ncbi:ribosomal protection-like ABC-F family protein [Terribacillus saccharophilus]|uniref:ribosomal protection-like ABC-F family protein n=1 Tax=Terribacillus saccharophilus TaxID=361277 RepID=UPI00298A0115|nr:ABC-F type ribosomal protection protein [Terribacillus saccharophilus]MCM3224729.1 ABC-F type ribosomal protection protein [Terribacillus saccharophilus]MEC0283373.1 ABC-F type ribosomal protection protein [Terribacillus saccharophilus]MEC0290329.1 ABC-F type ribosomal protection protein [Terribacillus saccharophilus]
MKELIKLQQLTYKYGERLIMQQANATVYQGDVIGIIGRNGAGKSTLLKLVAGKEHMAEGAIWTEDSIEIEIVEQERDIYTSESVLSEAAKLRGKWRVPSVSYRNMSGGEKLKTRLANGLSSRADVLLLDEPTNHLDEDSVNLLVEEIESTNKTLLIVSHDRYLLDRVATKIWSIEEQRLHTFAGNYTAYTDHRQKEKEAQQHAFEKQQKRIKQVEGQIASLQNWSAKAHAQSTKQEGAKEYYRKKAKRMDKAVKSKHKRLEKELEKEKVEAVVPDHGVSFELSSARKKGKRFLECKNVTKQYDDKVLFQDANFTIKHGEKIGLQGPNGCGKTTFFRMITGNEPYGGELWISPTANIGYLSQDVYDLPLDKAPAEIFHQESFAERGKVQTLLLHLGFEAESWMLPIEDMSMGERVKLKLMQHILADKDVLLLDEPTNHMDLPSREQLEQTLAAYSGTLLVISHDRYFREKVTDTQLIIQDGKMMKNLGTSAAQSDVDDDILLMQLENERQEVLGKLSMLTPGDTVYKDLDERFNQLTKRIRQLKN